MKPYYQDQFVTLYHGDCNEILPTLGMFDLLLTDPPYGIGADKEMSMKSGQQYGNACAPKGVYEMTDWDNKTPDKEVFQLIISKAKEHIIWGGNYFELPPSRCYLVWDKENGENNFADAELAWTSLDKPVRLKRHLWNGMLRKNGETRNGHPTQKPLDIIQWCVTQASNPKTILDPFAGSGTTGQACKAMGIQCVLIEREEKYCEIAVSRLAQEYLLL